MQPKKRLSQRSREGARDAKIINDLPSPGGVLNLRMRQVNLPF